MHAEAMLLVDDGQCQILEHHRLLHQRVGTHHHLRFAAGDLLHHLGARLAGDLAGQPGDAHTERFQPAAQVVEMLFGQQLGGRGQCNLLALLHRQHRRQRGDHGLAGTDVALHQPQHRAGPREVFTDLLEHARLRAGERERQLLQQRLGQLAGTGQWRRMVCLQCNALATQAEVVGQQLFHRQAALRRVGAGGQRGQVGIGRRPVHGQQRAAQ